MRPFGPSSSGASVIWWGRKVFLVTILVMGTATLVGLLPTFGSHTVPGVGTVAGIGWQARSSW